MRRVAALVLTIAALAGAAPPGGVSLVIRCNEGLSQTLRVGVEAYMTLHPEVKVTVLMAPPLRCAKAVAEGTADLALSTRVDTDQLQESLGPAAGHLEFQPVSRGALVFYVNQANPVSGLTMDQLRRIYTGQLTNWKQVGGPDAAIHLLSEDGDSGLYDNLRHDVLLPDQPISPRVRWVHWSDMGQSVSHDPVAIGYAGAGLNPPNSRRLNLNGVVPSAETLANGSYPAQRDICLVSLPSASAEARKLSQYLTSPEGFETWKGHMIRL